MSATKHHVVSFRIAKSWRALQTPVVDQRRHRRFNSATVTASLALVDSSEDGLRLQDCSLLNLSSGGMCLATQRPLHVDAEYPFLIQLGPPFNDLVLVRARIQWTESAVQAMAGAEFVESSKGWLGPDAIE